MTPKPKKPLVQAKVVTKRPRLFLPKSQAEWSYTFLVGAAAGVVFLARFLTDGPIAGLCFLIPAAVGFFFRWQNMPALSVLSLAYFLFAPGLVPIDTSNTLMIRLGHFDPMNIILAMATVTYLAAQYRLFAMIERAMPNDKPESQKADRDQHLRNIDIVPAGEWKRLFFIIGGCVIAAEFLWLGITELYIEPALSIPIRWAGPPMSESSGLPGSIPAPLSRLILSVLAIAGFVVVARFAFWYWRLARLNSEEGSAVIADTGWSENRREHMRNEVWRANALARTKRITP